MKRIVLTGGGTAGHVTPNLALLPLLREEGWEVLYIGSETGIEKKLMEEAGVPYYSVPTGKLRRYLSKQNLTDMFQVVKGVREAVDKDGFMGILTGGLTASAAGITAAIVFGLIIAVIFKPKEKDA